MKQVVDFCHVCSHAMRTAAALVAWSGACFVALASGLAAVVVVNLADTFAFCSFLLPVGAMESMKPLPDLEYDLCKIH